MKFNGCIFRICIYIVQIFYTVCLVLTCPTDLATWTQNSEKFACSNGKYHCGLTDNGTLQEFCFESRIIYAKYCPVFQIRSRIVLGVWNCTHNIPNIKAHCREQNLPQNSFKSNELYNYSVCFLGQEIYTSSTERSLSEAQSISKIYSNLTTLGTFINASPKLTEKQERSNKSLEENVSTNTTSNSTTILSAIAALFIIAVGMNIIFFWFMNRSKKQFISSNVDGMSVAEAIHEEDTYDCINELELQPSVMDENEKRESRLKP